MSSTPLHNNRRIGDLALPEIHDPSMLKHQHKPIINTTRNTHLSTRNNSKFQSPYDSKESSQLGVIRANTGFDMTMDQKMLDSSLLIAKQNRRSMEKDYNLISNRVQMLQKEEWKLMKKIEETRKKA